MYLCRPYLRSNVRLKAYRHLFCCLFPVIALLLPIRVKAVNQLTNLPSLYIQTKDNLPINSKSVYMEAYLEMVASDTTGLYNDTAQIRGRGNSTWGMAKKPYRLKLKDDVRFMGMTAKDNIWVLLANHADKTLFRNALAFEIGKACDMYFTPDYRFLDLVLNGKYIGAYMATDQVERNKNRVNVEKLTLEDVDPQTITGGYLLEIDGFASGEVEWFSGTGGYGVPVSVKYPDDEDINNHQRSYIRNHFSALEKAVRDFVVGQTDTSRLTKYLDLTAFARWYLSFELTANPDGIWSIYLKKHRDDDKFYFGPLWDNDISFGNCNRIYTVADDGRNESIMVRSFSNDSTKAMISKILNIPEVRQRICIEWDRISVGLEARLLHVIDSLAGTLDASQQLNFSNQVWPVLNSIVYNELTARGSYAAEVNFLRGYMDDRYDFVDNYIRSLVADPEVQFTPDPDRYYLVQCLNGKYLYAEPTGQGYRLAASTTFPSDSALARFEVVMTKKRFQEAVYTLRNEAANAYVYMNVPNEAIPLDPDNKTLFTLYDSPNDGTSPHDYYGFVSSQTTAALSGLGIDANGTNVVAWSTANKKAQREYRFLDAGKRITSHQPPVRVPAVGLAVKVFSERDGLRLHQLPEGLHVKVYSLDGRLVRTVLTDGYDAYLSLPRGLYLVTTGTERVKVAVR